MKKYIHCYLDESGNTLSNFFIVGGFFIINDDYANIQKIESKINSNLLKIEKSIKEFRKNYEPNLEQYISFDNNWNYKEVKWNSLTTNNKEFLFEKIKNFGQINFSMSFNLKNEN